ncbi:MAG TPA: S26 family signal peptidase [Jatrophihabitans sp.]|nr:S26 family signal peptidase [Jatrophihabitans sp.]
MTRLLRAGLLALFALLVLATLAFRFTGGQWMTVSTPSMGRTAPVGTLLLVRPDPHPQVGQFVVFHPPNQPRETYAHRLVAESSAGFKTRGDANGAADPWTLSADAVRGRVIARLWWLGWLLRTVPDLAIGALLTMVISALLPARHRLAARLVLGSLTVSLTIMLVRPFVQLVVLVNLAMDGRSSTTVVPTGLMPVTVRSLHGTSATLDPGQVGLVYSSHPGSDGQFRISYLPHVTSWWWLVAALGWLLPLVIAIIAGNRQQNAAQQHVSSVSG